MCSNFFDYSILGTDILKIWIIKNPKNFIKRMKLLNLLIIPSFMTFQMMLFLSFFLLQLVSFSAAHFGKIVIILLFIHLTKLFSHLLSMFSIFMLKLLFHLALLKLSVVSTGIVEFISEICSPKRCIILIAKLFQNPW